MVGLIGAVVGGVCAMIHYNALADCWRLQMHMEIEGANDISKKCTEFNTIAKFSDYSASALIFISVGSLTVAGTFAI